MSGGDFGWGLCREFEFEFVEQKLEFWFRLGGAGHDEFAPVSGGYMHVDHLHGSKLLQHAARGETGRQGAQSFGERDMQTIGKKRNLDVRFDAFFALMKDRPDR